MSTEVEAMNIVQVIARSDRAGLRRSDLIVKVSGKEIASVSELRLAISQTPPGASIPLEVVRDSRRVKIRVTLGSLENPAPLKLGGAVIPGVTLTPLDRLLRQQFKVPNAVSGLVVTKSSGEVQTIREGVVIVEINGQPAQDIEDARSFLRTGLNRFKVWFRGRFSFLPYRIP